MMGQPGYEPLTPRFNTMRTLYQYFRIQIAVGSILHLLTARLHNGQSAFFGLGFQPQGEGFEPTCRIFAAMWGCLSIFGMIFAIFGMEYLRWLYVKKSQLAYTEWSELNGLLRITVIIHKCNEIFSSTLCIGKIDRANLPMPH